MSHFSWEAIFQLGNMEMQTIFQLENIEMHTKIYLESAEMQAIKLGNEVQAKFHLKHYLINAS